MRMKFSKKFLPVVLFVMGIFAACSGDKTTEPKPQPVQGRITASVAGIAGQNGKVLVITAFNDDWFPGSESPVIAGFMTNITSDDFSVTQVLHPADSQAPGGYSAADMVFEPKTYSVVFFVAAPGNPPESFSEVRIAVNGDVTATAPAWASWVHP
jgi:hypothetical protein